MAEKINYMAALITVAFRRELMMGRGIADLGFSHSVKHKVAGKPGQSLIDEMEGLGCDLGADTGDPLDNAYNARQEALRFKLLYHAFAVREALSSARAAFFAHTGNEIFESDTPDNQRIAVRTGAQDWLNSNASRNSHLIFCSCQTLPTTGLESFRDTMLEACERVEKVTGRAARQAGNPSCREALILGQNRVFTSVEEVTGGYLRDYIEQMRDMLEGEK